MSIELHYIKCMQTLSQNIANSFSLQYTDTLKFSIFFSIGNELIKWHQKKPLTTPTNKL